MNFVIPMAGRGQRFVDAGYTQPKMLIKAKGKTLLEWSVDSLPLHLCTNLIFIGLEEHKEQFAIDQFIITKYGEICNVQQVYLNEVTRGQAETVLKAEKHINPEVPLVIFNIDTAFTSRTLAEKLLRNDVDGVLGSFKSDEPRFSYASVNDNGIINNVVEKEVISKHALTGLYHFRNPLDFINAAKAAIQNGETVKNEYYIAPLYKKLINESKEFILDHTDSHDILGTPEELFLFQTNPV